MRRRRCAWPRLCIEPAVPNTQGWLLDYCAEHTVAVEKTRAELIAEWHKRHDEAHSPFVHKQRKKKLAGPKVPRCRRCKKVRALDPCRKCATALEAAGYPLDVRPTVDTAAL